jgi:3',5'-cyclic AMP phosphodiesterase CpdA
VQTPLLVQLSDVHIGATWAPVDPLARLRACVEAIRHRPGRPDAVVVSGDLADHGSPEEYALIKAELARLGVPVHVVPGNHDDRRALRSCFGLPGEDAAPVSYAADAGPLRLILLDSTVPGEDRGDIGLEQLGWLDTTLAADPARPTLLVMHHPPLLTGVPAWDSIGLAEAGRLELARLVAQHPQVRGMVAGHLHRPIAAAAGGRVAFIAPSTYVPARLDVAADHFLFADEEPPAFALHAFPDGDLVSHVQLVVGNAGHPA